MLAIVKHYGWQQISNLGSVVQGKHSEEHSASA